MAIIKEKNVIEILSKDEEEIHIPIYQRNYA
jgi:hypothetical protein